MANDAMREVWNGGLVHGWVERHTQYDAMLEPFAQLVLEFADFNETDRILDVGCGTGALTRMAAHACPHGSATGVDVSRPLLDEARRLSEGLEHVRYVEADAQTHDLVPAEAVVSRFGVMFFDDPSAAFANLHRVTEPDGSLVFVCWRGLFDNPWSTVPMGAAFSVAEPPALPEPGAPGPFAFEDRNHLAVLLTEAGWADLRIEAHDQPVLLGGGLDADHAADFVLGDVVGRMTLANAGAEQQAAVRAAVREALAPHETPDGVALDSAAWLVQAHNRRD